jgi:hypothetical protein
VTRTDFVTFSIEYSQHDTFTQTGSGQLQGNTAISSGSSVWFVVRLNTELFPLDYRRREIQQQQRRQQPAPPRVQCRRGCFQLR